jgi:hypothetical protein
MLSEASAKIALFIPFTSNQVDSGAVARGHRHTS